MSALIGEAISSRTKEEWKRGSPTEIMTMTGNLSRCVKWVSKMSYPLFHTLQISVRCESNMQWGYNLYNVGFKQLCADSLMCNLFCTRKMNGYNGYIIKFALLNAAISCSKHHGRIMRNIKPLLSWLTTSLNTNLRFLKKKKNFFCAMKIFSNNFPVNYTLK